MHSEPELDAQARGSQVGRIAERERERERERKAESIFTTSYRPQANVAALTDRVSVQNVTALTSSTPLLHC